MLVTLRFDGWEKIVDIDVVSYDRGYVKVSRILPIEKKIITYEGEKPCNETSTEYYFEANGHRRNGYPVFELSE